MMQEELDPRTQQELLVDRRELQLAIPRAPGTNRWGEAYKRASLGLLKHNRDPAFPWYEWQYLKTIKRFLLYHWRDMQTKYDEETLQSWVYAFRVLELDRKAQRDLMLLSHSGLVGRTKANRILHSLLHDEGLHPDYWDLSHYVSAQVMNARYSMDRPPRMHR